MILTPQKPPIGNKVEAFKPPTDATKKSVPIRQRKVFREIEKEVNKILEFWKLIQHRRDLYSPAEEAQILGDLSFHTFRAKRFIEERIKPEEKEETNGE
jgi:hypothetical protein